MLLQAAGRTGCFCNSVDGCLQRLAQSPQDSSVIALSINEKLTDDDERAKDVRLGTLG
jgi:hypothetical protein